MLAVPAPGSALPPAPSGAASLPDPVPVKLSPGEAAAWLDHPRVVFVDAREGLLPFAARVPGSRPARWRDFLDPSAPSPTGRLDRDPARLGARLGALGIRPDTWVIAYGDPLSGWGEEGRFFWMMEAVGHPRASVIDGGFPAWRAAGLPTARLSGSAPDRPSPLTVSYRVDRFASRDEVLGATRPAPDGPALLDTRSSEEFAGATPHGERRGGSIPGARPFWFRRFVDGDGRLRPRAEVLDELAALGVRPDRPVYAYCTGGVRSGFAYWALRAYGFPRVANYDGSFWEWAADPALPVAP